MGFNLKRFSQESADAYRRDDLVPGRRARMTTIVKSVLMVVGACGILVGGPAAEPLTVRVNDAVGVPGSTIALVLRTYASRPIGQGQLCMQAAPTLPGATTPVAMVLGAEVFSDVPDVSSNVIDDLTMVPQSVVLEFTSPSVSVNASDGPMAVVFLQLSPDVLPGETYELVLDLANTVLIDGDGLAIDVTPRNGTLRIRAPDDPWSAEASAENVVPGDAALLSFETNELFPILSGQIGLQYDTSIAAGPPVVTMNPLHGNAAFVADTSTPGLVVVSFTSVDATLNSLPGDLIEVLVPTSPAVPVGTGSPVTLDESLTWLFDADGQSLPLAIESDVLEFVATPVLSPGAVSDLTLSRSSGGGLFLDWQPDCGSGTSYAVYRGNLAEGYDSLSFEPGFCSVAATSTELPLGAGDADFFLVVPVLNGFEGEFGFQWPTDTRPPAAATCHPQGSTDDCAD